MDPGSHGGREENVIYLVILPDAAAELTCEQKEAIVANAINKAHYGIGYSYFKLKEYENGVVVKVIVKPKVKEHAAEIAAGFGL